MRKAGRILVLLAGLGIILGIAVRAEAQENAGSRGAVQVQGVGGSIQVWSQDVMMLQNMAGVISTESFDPAFYAAPSISVEGMDMWQETTDRREASEQVTADQQEIIEQEITDQ